MLKSAKMIKLRRGCVTKFQSCVIFPIDTKIYSVCVSCGGSHLRLRPLFGCGRCGEMKLGNWECCLLWRVGVFTYVCHMLTEWSVNTFRRRAASIIASE